MKIYIRSASQISIQEPLNDSFFENPIICNNRFARAIEPNYKDYFDAMQHRRLGNLLKRAIVTSRTAISKSGLDSIDAIIMGTGWGCAESTEKFLRDMLAGGEQLLKPTNFIQSTHNTISSQIAIDMACHGYNSTYVHKGISFDSALLDAFVLLRTQQINNALIGGHDELTDDLFNIFDRLGKWNKNGVLGYDYNGDTFASEGSVCMTLSNGNDGNAYATIDDMDIVYGTDEHALVVSLNMMMERNNMKISDIDFVMTGVNGDYRNDSIYLDKLMNVFENRPSLRYKNICGEYFTSSAFGVYTAAYCLKKGSIPTSLIMDNMRTRGYDNVNKILFYNHSFGKNHSLILLSSC